MAPICNPWIRMLRDGGSFWFREDKYTVSQAVGERVLLPAVRNAPADALIVSDGFIAVSRYSKLQAPSPALAEAMQLGLRRQDNNKIT